LRSKGITELIDRFKKIFTFMGVLPMSGSEILRLCKDLRVLPSTDAEGINEDIAIVDWLVDICGTLDW